MSHEMTLPSNEKEAASPSTGIVVGIDPGLDKHGVVALVAGSCYLLERRMIANTVAGMEALVELLKGWQGQSAGHLTVAIEEASAFGEALECYVSQAGFDAVVVSSLKVARFREALGADGNDLIDAEAVARLIMVQPDLGSAPPRKAVEADSHGCDHLRLRQLSRRHARWTREHTAVCNELHAVLRMAWLADYQRFFSNVDGVAALAVWQQYPTPSEAAEAKLDDLAALIRRASRGRITPEDGARKSRDIQGTGKIMVFALGKKNPKRWLAWAEDIRMLANHLGHLNSGLKQMEREIKELLESINSPLISFKGIGPVTAAAIHGETLSIERFATADRFARYNGTAPREDSSGRKPKHVKNRRCNKRLRQAFMQLALNAPRHQVASKIYLKHLESRGITQGAARIRLARRLSDIVYAMLRDGRDYDLEYHVRHKTSAA